MNEASFHGEDDKPSTPEVAARRLDEFHQEAKRLTALLTVDEQGDASKRFFLEDGRTVAIVRSYSPGTDRMTTGLEITEQGKIIPTPDGGEYWKRPSRRFLASERADNGIGMVLFNETITTFRASPDAPWYQQPTEAVARFDYEYNDADHQEILSLLQECPTIQTSEDLMNLVSEALDRASIVAVEKLENGLSRKSTYEVADAKVTLSQKPFRETKGLDLYTAEIVIPVQEFDGERQTHIVTITSTPILGGSVLVIEQPGWEQWDPMSEVWVAGSRLFDGTATPDDIVPYNREHDRYLTAILQAFRGDIAEEEM